MIVETNFLNIVILFIFFFFCFHLSSTFASTTRKYARKNTAARRWYTVKVINNPTNSSDPRFVLFFAPPHRHSLSSRSFSLALARSLSLSHTLTLFQSLNLSFFSLIVQNLKKYIYILNRTRSSRPRSSATAV